MKDIHQELVNVKSRAELAVLATVVSSRGSSPRKAEANMLIRGDGTFISAVGGGEYCPR